MSQIASHHFTALPLAEIEAELINSLNPVRPDPIFVDQLGQRLKRRPAIVLEDKPIIGFYLIMASGLFFGAFLLWILGYLYQFLRKV